MGHHKKNIRTNRFRRNDKQKQIQAEHSHIDRYAFKEITYRNKENFVCFKSIVHNTLINRVTYLNRGGELPFCELYLKTGEKYNGIDLSRIATENNFSGIILSEINQLEEKIGKWKSSKS